MKERGILFSAPMVRALLDGTKTQTRRVVKITHRTPGLAACLEPSVGAPRPRVAAELCPYGQPGDRLWVREAHSIGPGLHVHLEPDETAGSLRWPHVTYMADGQMLQREKPWKGVFGKPIPSIHMFRWASRIDLDVTEVRVERLRDITPDEAIAEGMKGVTKDGELTKYGIPDRDGLPGADDTGWPWHEWRISPVDAYQRLWEQINGAGSWDANPWVWAVSFKVVQS